MIYGKRICLLMLVLLLTANLSGQVKPRGVYFVRDYHAVGDGKHLDSPAINAAIEACFKAGGGTVYLSPGVYLSGSIRLKSNVELHLAKGAVLKAAPNNINAYDRPDPNPWYIPEPHEWVDFGHCFWKNSLLWAVKEENIAVTGLGTIDGTNLSCGIVSPGQGNKTFGLKLCRNILIKDITIINGGWFCILPTGCENMVIESLKIDTNRDGINLDCCRNVRVANCTINSPGDDALVFKSSYALGYLKATEDVTVTNCLMSGFQKKGSRDYPAMLHGAYEGLGNGRIKFGTESNGGFRNIVISNCVLEHCYGISLQINDGGTMENIAITNIVMNDVVGGPITVEITARGRGPNNPPVGKMRNIIISNIISNDSFFGCAISGIKGHPIENITLSNIQIISHGDGSRKDAARMPEDNVKEPWQGAKWHMPSYAFFCRHVKGLTFRNIRVDTRIKDLRPAFIFSDVHGLELYGIKARRYPGSESPVQFRAVTGVTIDNCPSLPLVKPLCCDFRGPGFSLLPGEPFAAHLSAKSEKSGLAAIRLLVDSQTLATEYVWLDSNKTRKVTFHDLRIDKPGSHKLALAKQDGVKPVVVKIKPQQSAALPLIFDTDIGADMDDTWTLAVLLNSPELDLKLVTTDSGNTKGKAKLVAKFLDRAGRADIPVGIGLHTSDRVGNQGDWAKDYDLDKYPGTTYRDGVQAIIDTVMHSSRPVTILATGPVPNLAEALKRQPEITRHARLVVMGGCIKKTWFKDPGGPKPESNIKHAIKAAQVVYAADWDITMAPLDTAGGIMLGGNGYLYIRDACNPVAQSLMEGYRVWAPKVNFNHTEEHSSGLFDIVALSLLIHPEFLCLQDIRIHVTDTGMTVPDTNGKLIHAAMQWRDLGGFFDMVVERISAYKTSR